MAEEKKEELGPMVLSKKNIVDQHVDFSIKTSEMKNLPKNYESSKLIMYSLKVGDLVLNNNQTNKKEIEKDVSLDAKDVGNFLNQNTTTVIKQLRINNLSKKDLDALAVAERKNKQRKKILDFIKSLYKVS